MQKIILLLPKLKRRRVKEKRQKNIRLEDIILDTNKTKAYMGSKELDISKQAFQLLLLFQKGTEHFCF